MRIGFDAKRAFLNDTGLGNYSRDAIRVLSHFYTDNKYFLYFLVCIKSICCQESNAKAYE